MSFFNGFSFDTLLSTISCIASVAALFVGGTAYKKCKIIKKSFNDKKEFGDNGIDNSQKTTGDIINNQGISNEQLITITNSLTTMNSANFSQALDCAYSKFQEQCDTNLEQIINKTKEIVAENKFQIGSYSKVDWIHIYFESAKNSSDKYMQSVWARVLAKELSQPNSFSYKTLDVLKNMSSEDFKLFEKLCSCEIDGYIFCKSKYYDKYNLHYVYLLQLNEHGLLYIKESEKTYMIQKQKNASIVCSNKLILMANHTDNDIELKVDIYLLTSVANELKSIVDLNNDDYIIDFINEMHTKNKELHISLHHINYILNGRINYNSHELFSVG